MTLTKDKWWREAPGGFRLRSSQPEWKNRGSFHFLHFVTFGSGGRGAREAQHIRQLKAQACGCRKAELRPPHPFKCAMASSSIAPPQTFASWRAVVGRTQNAAIGLPRKGRAAQQEFEGRPCSHNLPRRGDDYGARPTPLPRAGSECWSGVGKRGTAVSCIALGGTRVGNIPNRRESVWGAKGAALQGRPFFVNARRIERGRSTPKRRPPSPVTCSGWARLPAIRQRDFNVGKKWAFPRPLGCFIPGSARLTQL